MSISLLNRFIRGLERGGNIAYCGYLINYKYLCNRLQLREEDLEVPAANYSHGMKQKLCLVASLLNNPDIWILDEPTVGLDPQQIIEIRNLIKSLGKKHTVILSSHVLSEVSATCDRIIVISSGKLVADAKTEELSTSISGDQKLKLDIEGSQNEVLNALKTIPGILKVRKNRDINENVGRYIVEYQNGIDVRRNVFRAIAGTSCVILDMQSGNETLEESFLQLTAQDQTKGGNR